MTHPWGRPGDRNLLARMLAGIDGDGRLVVAAVDGPDTLR